MKFIVILLALPVLSILAKEAETSPLTSLAKLIQPAQSDRKCIMCKFSVSLINYALKTKRGSDEIDRIANNFCNIAHLESPLVCSSISKLFNHEVTKVLSYGVITPDQVCGYISNNTCGHFHNPLDDWEVSLNVSASLDGQDLLVKQRIEKALSEDQPPFKVLHISDTHVDLKYKEGSPAVCNEPLCCQATSSPSNKSQERAGYWGHYGLCDVPMRTFESALKTLNATIRDHANIEYIIWTGDIQPHDVWSQNKKTAVKIYDQVFEKIFEYLPNIKILPTLGNHEMVPVDSFSPSNLLSIARDDSPEWLYRKLDSFWSRWLPANTVATITKDGFYSAPVRDGLKVVSLNTNFCHSKNFWLYINSTDPGNQLQWLIHELQISELLNEKVHIIGHIPPGADDCLKVWSKNYNKILRRFSRTVTGQFFGHTHNNEFELFYDLEGVTKSPSSSSEQFKTLIGEQKSIETDSIRPISVGWIGPSITTFVDLNPSFRIYDINPKLGFMPVDFETYIMNLTLANRMGPNEPKWESVGLFSKTFGVQDIAPESIHNMLVNLVGELNDQMSGKAFNAENKDASFQLIEQADNGIENGIDNAKLYQLYRLFNSYSDKFSEAVYSKISLVDKKKFICRLFTGQAHDPTICNKYIGDI